MKPPNKVNALFGGLKFLLFKLKKIPTKPNVSLGFLVRVTGCGCPVDTSVHCTEAPTEATAETLNLRLPLAVSRKLLSTWCVGNFRPQRHFKLAVSHTVSARSQCLTPTGCQSAANLISAIQIKKQSRPFGRNCFLVRVTGLDRLLRILFACRPNASHSVPDFTL